MKTRLIGAAVVALALLSPAPGLTDENIKYSQCLNTFKEKGFFDARNGIHFAQKSPIGAAIR